MSETSSTQHEYLKDLKYQLEEARKWRSENVCDCHTWPTVLEMHEYCVALEKQLASKDAILAQIRNGEKGGLLGLPRDITREEMMELAKDALK